MQDDPYSAIASIMRESAKEAAPAGHRIGKVITVAPLTVDVNGAIQEQGALVFALPLQVPVNVDKNTGPVEQQHSHAARISREAPVFERGDILYLEPIEDEQRYIIWARLVGL